MCCKPAIRSPRPEYGVAVLKRRGRACGIYVGSIHSPPTKFPPRPTGGLTIGCRGGGAEHVFGQMKALRSGPAPLTLEAR
jgi:hypothetical protein